MLLPILLYALLGLVVEVIYTAVYAAAEAAVDQTPVDPSLKGHTYLWMMPIYGLGGLLFEFVFHVVESHHWGVRGLIYTAGIFAVEYIAGWIIEQMTGSVPWDYSERRWHVQGKIRLDYAPVWFCFGLFLEKASHWIQATSIGLHG